MDKETFLRTINEENKNQLSSIYDKVQLTRKTQKIIYTHEFSTPNVWKPIKQLERELQVQVYVNGVFPEGERRMMAFSTLEVPQIYPLQLLQIQSKSKFVTLQHKDYLGAIMSLGIKREKFGDLLLNEKGAFVPVSEEISDYVLYHLESIGRAPCEVKVIDTETQGIPTINLKEQVIIATSLRLDAMVGALCNVSRTKAVEILQAGKVWIDYTPCTRKDKIIEKDTIITIRGYGKYKILEEIGVTQKDRRKILINQYV